MAHGRKHSGTPTLAISLGYVTGTGPEVTLKALRHPEVLADCSFVLIGDAKHLQELNSSLHTNLNLEPYASKTQPGRIYMLHAGLCNSPVGTEHTRSEIPSHSAA